VIFDHIIVNVGSFGSALGSRLNINIRHTHISLLGQLSLS
jgi:chromosome condensin MukBEF ATPase and DNA-binding subunit MukB